MTLAQVRRRANPYLWVHLKDGRTLLARLDASLRIWRPSRDLHGLTEPPISNDQVLGWESVTPPCPGLMCGAGEQLPQIIDNPGASQPDGHERNDELADPWPGN